MENIPWYLTGKWFCKQCRIAFEVEEKDVKEPVHNLFVVLCPQCAENVEKDGRC